MKRICLICKKEFEFDRPQRIYCSVACRKKSMSKKKREYLARVRTVGQNGKDRPSREFTSDTVFLCHKWAAEGDCITDIAELMDRPESDIQAALETRIARRDWLAIQKSFIPTRKARKVK